MAIADAKGMVKGRVDNPAADPPLRSDGKLNVAEAVGLGASGVGRWCGGCGIQPYIPLLSSCINAGHQMAFVLGECILHRCAVGGAQPPQ